ncbi:transcriptional regulator [Acinetobacter phage AP22]|uniref:Putative transcriptional regulator n=1 Tax=Acinetobacter phage AP22 TaxID=1187128 RepID=I2GUH5_9CAUD|nr:transcriptional regulator [Acinetobacter phage AP22]CCH57776.1 putative transcriptional regulator [Acinetobacter phage AP22]
MKNLHGFKLEIIPVSEDDKLKRKAPSIVISYFVDSEPQLIKMSATQYEGNSNMNEMIKKIHQAKKELGLNNSELSLRMGKSRPYIAKMLNQPQSEKVQNKVIKEIDELLEFEQRCKEKEYARCASELNIPVSINDLSVQKHQDNEKDKEISDLKKVIESKDLAISGLIKQNDEAKKIHDKDVKALADKDDQILLLTETNQHTADRLYYFVNQYKQSESDVASLKSKIKRERIIILIIIVILTALFFLKGSIGG